MGEPRRIPDALPQDVVDAIWREVLPDLDPTVFEAIRTHAVLPSREALVEFTEIAIAAPHYATGGDIAKALGTDIQQINWIIRQIRTEARENRQCPALSS